ncbi:hypothetical protein M9980_05160 [Sphingomonas donggukensis]|uniref:Uncharacterized protein n=1 Tax=Sphingomonas donggukensis TaxID=2949093 RepID=A0ABY4U228_9SPHN|nr:hypothetical protein [Sphingomonas donggukensis]URW76603.1 hypothetical protein M9980_05160 [Sphingomonas donggukensis]
MGALAGPAAGPAAIAVRPTIALSVPVAVGRTPLPITRFAAPLVYSVPRPVAAVVLTTRDRLPVTQRIGANPVLHDPLQFASVRALRFDRGRYRASPLDAKLEFRMTGAATSLDLAGGVPRIVRKALH